MGYKLGHIIKLFIQYSISFPCRRLSVKQCICMTKVIYDYREEYNLYFWKNTGRNSHSFLDVPMLYLFGFKTKMNQKLLFSLHFLLLLMNDDVHISRGGIESVSEKRDIVNKLDMNIGEKKIRLFLWGWWESRSRAAGRD